MLVLARKVGQQIVISDNIEITVLEVRGEQVRLGITADRSISIHRKELLTQAAEAQGPEAGASGAGASGAGASATEKAADPTPPAEEPSPVPDPEPPTEVSL